jgi:dihydroneopterin aldolase/D-erythro-7,8-dihydroneopterin triphosphate epimerase
MVRCIIGVDPEERRERQDVVINIALSADARKAGRTDDLKDAVDYRSIKKEVYAMAEESQYNLVESLAERVAEICLAHDGVEQAIVTVEKPAALRFARSVAVEVTRSR